jgi:hypothetical protein
MISIPNLSPLQQELCDAIWSCDTSEQLTAWYKSLPRSIKPVAYAMINMVMFEVLDADVNDGLVDMSESQSIIDHIQSL